MSGEQSHPSLLLIAWISERAQRFRRQFPVTPAVLAGKAAEVEKSPAGSLAGDVRCVGRLLQSVRTSSIRMSRKNCMGVHPRKRRNECCSVRAFTPLLWQMSPSESGR